MKTEFRGVKFKLRNVLTAVLTTVAIAGDLMEPIQVKLSFWDFISPDEVDVTDSEESIKQPHVYILAKVRY